MSEATIEAPASAPAPFLPPSPRLPKAVQAFGFVASRRRMVEAMTRRHGDVFTLRVPVFGDMVAVADPQIAKQLFAANTDDVGNIQPNLSRILGSGSVSYTHLTLPTILRV